MKVRNVVTALRQPHIGGAYLRWLLERRLLGRQPQKTIRNQVTVSGFSGFSEYLAVDNFISDDEHLFFSQHEFGPGDIVDIGANLGVLSIFLAKRFPTRTVYSIEPNPHTAVSLAENVKLNQLSNVSISEIAIADKSGAIRFNADPVSRGTASIAKDNGKSTKSVTCTTLDQYVEARKITQIGLLKVDVEGYEYLVFSGARRTLLQVQPGLIYFEVCPPITEKAGFDPSTPASMLLDVGYSLFKLNGKGRLVRASISEICAVEYANWIATRDPGMSAAE